MRLIILIVILSHSFNLSSQVEKIKIKKSVTSELKLKKLDTSLVRLSLANMNHGTISIDKLAGDPTVRIKSKTNQDYTLKKFTVNFDANDQNYDYKGITNKSGPMNNMLQIIKSAKSKFPTDVYVYDAIIVDQEGNESTHA